MTEVPERIREALEARRVARRHSATDSADTHEPISRGDVRVLRPPSSIGGGESRLCLVLGVDSSGEYADAVLIHTAPELATSADGVVPSVVSGAPYDTVIETDLRGAVWTFQLGRKVGHLDSDTLEELGDIAVGGTDADTAMDSKIWSGSVLTGESDRRWAFKASEGNVFRTLTLDCTAVLVDGGTVWELDPEVLLGGQLRGVAADPAATIALGEWRMTRKTRRFTIRDEVLHEALRVDIPSPSSEADMANELATLGWLLAADVSTDPSSPRPTSTRCVVTTRSLRRAEHETLEAVHILGEVVTA